jgi:hypothetical protein
MEYRRRTLSSIDDDEIITSAPVEIGRRRRGTSVSIDSQIDDYVEYMYSNTYNVSTSVFSGILNLICPCFRRKAGPDISTSSL